MLAWLSAGIILCLLLWVGINSRLESDRKSVSEHAFKLVQSQSRSYAEQLLRTIEQIDQITMILKDEWESSQITLNLEQRSEKGIFPERVLLAYIVDRNGDIVTSSLRAGNRPNAAQEDYFRMHAEGRVSGLLISRPEIGKLTGLPIVYFSRRLEKPDGTFDGVAVSGVEPSFLATFHDESLLGKGDFVSVRFADGPLLATKANADSGLPIVIYRKDPVFGPPEGILREPAEKFRDDQARIVAWKKLDRYPIVALAAMSEANVYAPNKAVARTYRNMAVAGTIFLLLFTAIGMAFSARLTWRRQQSEEVKRAYRLATDAANEGFFMIRPLYGRDGAVADFQLEDCNERGAAMLGLRRERIVGRRVSELPYPAYRKEIEAVYLQAMEKGFHEEEVRVSPPSPLKAAWVYRRAVRSEMGLALTVRDISEAKAHEQTLSKLANTDALTMLPNRHWLSNFLPTAVENASNRSGARLAILFIDLDNFKNINDTLGHEAGDELLKIAAHRLKSAVRANDHVVRLGGDEFTIILEQVDTVDDVARVARQSVKTICEPFTLLGTDGHRVNASIGVSMYPQDGRDGETLLKHADIAMYAAKAAGKGRYHFYQSHLSDTLILKLSKEQALRHAVECDEFVVHYQPRVGTDSGRLNSMEALVRWQHPERGLVYPTEFIDLAEDTGLILRLGELVIEKVCAQIAQWKRQNVEVVPVSINVSPLQLMEGNISSFLCACIARNGIDPALIEVELTESSMIEKRRVVASELANLRAAGIKILIDDFGTGYSSLAQLQSLDVDIIKVDGAFTAALGQGNEGKALFRAIVSMAGALGICVVAEGVETADQLHALQALACDEIQGHFISGALPANEVQPLMRKRFLFAPSFQPRRPTLA